MSDYNVILISMDAVRPDHLSPYGSENKTPNIDLIAKEGVVFENASAVSCLTPICHASMLTGNIPPTTNVRDPFCYLEGTPIGEILKERGYATAGFCGVGFLGKLHGFARGFDHYNEPQEGGVWGSKRYLSEDSKDEQDCAWGNWWLTDMFDWLKGHVNENFFLFGHYFECHWGSEKYMLEKGWLDKDYKPEQDYYDAKIEYMDKHLYGPLISMLKEAGVWDKTIVIITADHGENLGEHPVPPPYYPQHRDLYECTIRIPLIIKAPSLRKGQRVKGLVRTIDIVPTVYEALGIKDVGTEGVSLTEFVRKGASENIVSYAEELYQRRGYGDFQSLKSDVYKYIVDRRSGKEEFFDIKKDPGEKNNLIGKLSDEEKKMKDDWRKICDKLVVRRKSSMTLSDKQRKQIEKRLKALGYHGGQ